MNRTISGIQNAIRFSDFVLDLEQCVLVRAGAIIPLRPKSFDVLKFAAQNPGRVLTKDELIEAVWGQVHVTDDSLVQCVREIRQALSDDAREILQTIPKRGYLFSTPANASRTTVIGNSSDGDVNYCHTSDGVKIAVGATGQGLPIIRPPTWFNHLAYDWHVDFRSALYHVVAENNQLIRYDGRGSGLSDRFVEDISFDAFGHDLEAVAQSYGTERYGLFGISQGGSIAMAHAARHPDKVAKLILNGTYALGMDKRGSVRDAETGEAYLTLMRHGWGDEHSGFLRSYGMLHFPSASSEELRASADVQRMAMSADVAVRTRTACLSIDVCDQLSKITAPTLILHSRHDNAVPLEEGERLAELIPNARFVVLESENHCPMPNEPAWSTFANEIREFLTA